MTASIGGIGSFLGPVILPILYDHFHSIKTPLFISLVLVMISFLFAMGIIILDYSTDKKDEKNKTQIS